MNEPVNVASLQASGLKHPDWLWVTRLPIQRVLHHLSSVIQRSDLGTDHSHPSSKAIKVNGAILPLPTRLYGFLRHNFTSYESVTLLDRFSVTKPTKNSKSISFEEEANA
jgi:hypothetical protein